MKLVLIVPDVNVVVVVRVRMTGDSDAVPLSAAVELETPEGVVCALLDAVVSSGLGSGLADIAIVVFEKLGGGAADGTCPSLLDEVGDVEFNHTDDSVRGEAVGRSIVVVNGEGVVRIGVREREICVLVRLCEGPRLVMIGTGTADDGVGTIPGGTVAVVFGSLVVGAIELEVALGSALSVVRPVVTPYARGVEDAGGGWDSGKLVSVKIGFVGRTVVACIGLPYPDAGLPSPPSGSEKT